MAKVPSNIQRRSLAPVEFPKTTHNRARVLNTSARAGKTYPAGFIKLRPMDALVAGSACRITVAQEEMEKVIGNAVRIRAHAYFVSYAALERYDGMDAVAHAFAGRAGAQPIFHGYTPNNTQINLFYKPFGLHVRPDDVIDKLYVQAFNAVIDHRRQEVSTSLPLRPNDGHHDLPRALWGQTALARIVPDFDAALIEASIPLTWTSESLNVAGRAIIENIVTDGAVVETQLDDLYTGAHVVTDGGSPTGQDGGVRIRAVNDPTHPDASGNASGVRTIYANADAAWSDLVAELTGSDATISLAQINNAPKIKAFARLRSMMAGTDEDLINLLMKGFRIPSAAYSQPILLGTAEKVISQVRRYATDGSSLDQMAVNGGASLTIPLTLPEQQTGGAIVMTYEIVPEPVFDRQADLTIYKTEDEQPDALRDYLDTQPVDVVPNRFVDALHTDPDGTFGYAPLNHWLTGTTVAMGGKHYRDLTVSETDEDQLHIWSVRAVDPVLNEDCFLVPENLSHYVFSDSQSDPYLVNVIWSANIRGITQFGPALYESQGDFEAVAAEIPTDTITQE